MCERHPLSRERFHSILEMRSVKHQYWIENCEKHGELLIVRHEDVLANSVQVALDLSRAIGVELPSKIICPNIYKRPSIKKKIARFATFGLYGTYRPKQKESLKAEDIELIREHLDSDVERLSGYDLRALTAGELDYLNVS